MQRVLLLTAVAGGSLAAGAWACGDGLAQVYCATTIPVFVRVDPAFSAGSLTADGGCTSPTCSQVLDSGGCQDWVLTWTRAEGVDELTCELVLTFPDGGQIRQIVRGDVRCGGPTTIEAGFPTGP
jgi:hypothetical protein